MEFLSALTEFTFLKNALYAGVLASLACGVTGTFVVLKKISYMSGGISHAVLGGIGIAYFLGINPLLGALTFAMFCAASVGFVTVRLKQNEDTLISALWSLGMAVGIIFMHFTPGYNMDLLAFLFGNILMVTSENLTVLCVLDVLILVIVFVFYRQLVYLCFDETYLRVRGISVEWLYLLLLLLIALAIVILIQVVGIILLIALLTIPASIAQLFSKSPASMMFKAVLLGIGFVLTGVYVSYQINLPAGAVIIVVASLVYFLVVFYHQMFRVRLR